MSDPIPLTLTDELKAQVSPVLDQKLAEYTFCDDNAKIVEYVLLLLTDGRTKADVLEDLVDFLDDNAGAFVDFLWTHLAGLAEQEDEEAAVPPPLEDFGVNRAAAVEQDEYIIDAVVEGAMDEDVQDPGAHTQTQVKVQQKRLFERSSNNGNENGKGGSERKRGGDRDRGSRRDEHESGRGGKRTSRMREQDEREERSRRGSSRRGDSNGSGRSSGGSTIRTIQIVTRKGDRERITVQGDRNGSWLGKDDEDHNNNNDDRRKRRKGGNDDRDSNNSSSSSRDSRRGRENDRSDRRDRNTTRDRRGANNQQERKPKGPHADKVKVRCSYFPNCTNEQCKFIHPTEDCKHYPNCKLGNKCTYLHPAKPAIACFYGSSCTNARCTFDHTNAPKQISKAVVECRYGAACTYAQCHFAHPGRAGQEVHVTGGAAAASKSAKNPAIQNYQIKCKNDPDCEDEACEFAHPVRKMRKLQAAREAARAEQQQAHTPEQVEAQ
jgi:hypothetical protein